MRRRFWYSESSVAADKPDDLLSEPELADDNTSLTLAYATGDLGYAVGNAEDSLFDKTCSALMPYISKVKYPPETKRTFAIPTPMSWLPRITAPVKGS